MELSCRFRFSRATSKGMISTQPMALKLAKSRRSSSSEEELSSRISVERRSSWTNRLRSARSPSRAWRSDADILGSFNLEGGRGGGAGGGGGGGGGGRAGEGREEGEGREGERGGEGEGGRGGG